MNANHEIHTGSVVWGCQVGVACVNRCDRSRLWRRLESFTATARAFSLGWNREQTS